MNADGTMKDNWLTPLGGQGRPSEQVELRWDPDKKKMEPDQVREDSK